MACIRRYGIPQSVYLDRHSTYKAPVHHQTIEDQLEDRQSLSHFERSLQALKVTVIHAYSPQAKGRVERLFGTFQDRLVKEMRLAGISNQEQGNAFLKTYLPKYNKQFRVAPAQDTDLHRPFRDHRQLDRILSIRTERALRNDFTIAHDKRLYQIKDNIRAKKVVVEERTDGTMRILHNDQRLRYQEITVRPDKKPKQQKEFQKVWERKKPARNHLWRSSYPFSEKEPRPAAAAS